MTKSQIQQLVVVLLLLTFVGVWLLTRKGPFPPKAAPAYPAGKAASAALPKETAAAATPAPISLGELQTLRDPFRIPALLEGVLREREAQKEQERIRLLEKQRKPRDVGELKAPPPNLQLQGILWGVAQPRAIINRQIVSVGDRVGNAKVLTIRKDAVTVLLEGEELRLSLPEKVRQEDRGRRTQDEN